MTIFIRNKEGRPMSLDKKQRQWAAPVKGAPAFYRSRNWPYKGRRTRVKVYPTFPMSVANQVIPESLKTESLKIIRAASHVS
jgi:hypothetical protein